MDKFEVDIYSNTEVGVENVKQAIEQGLLCYSGDKFKVFVSKIDKGVYNKQLRDFDALQKVLNETLESNTEFLLLIKQLRKVQIDLITIETRIRLKLERGLSITDEDRNLHELAINATIDVENKVDNYLKD